MRLSKIIIQNKKKEIKTGGILAYTWVGWISVSAGKKGKSDQGCPPTDDRRISINQQTPCPEKYVAVLAGTQRRYIKKNGSDLIGSRPCRLVFVRLASDPPPWPQSKTSGSAVTPRRPRSRRLLLLLFFFSRLSFLLRFLFFSSRQPHAMGPEQNRCGEDMYQDRLPPRNRQWGAGTGTSPVAIVAPEFPPTALSLARRSVRRSKFARR
ncbi:hypothetical protein VTO42DRAFT_7607 [Malbranchea cinnamomea]